jgi:hypothetical protein
MPNFEHHFLQGLVIMYTNVMPTTQEEILSFSVPHILTIVRFDYISTTFYHLKFASGFIALINYQYYS